MRNERRNRREDEDRIKEDEREEKRMKRRKRKKKARRRKEEEIKTGGADSLGASGITCSVPPAPRQIGRLLAGDSPLAPPGTISAN